MIIGEKSPHVALSAPSTPIVSAVVRVLLRATLSASVVICEPLVNVPEIRFNEASL